MSNRGRPAKYNYDDPEIDWANQTNAAIARYLGCSTPMVCRMRKALGKPISPRCHRGTHPEWYDWSSVDWTRQDVEIASQLGCTRARVSQRRKALGKPKADWHGCRRTGKARAGDVFRLHGQGLTPREIAVAMGCTPPTVRSRLARLGLSPNKRSKWKGADWDLPDADLNEIWGVCNVGSVRRQYGWPAKWTRSGAALHGKVHVRDGGKEYAQALQRERERAREFANRQPGLA